MSDFYKRFDELYFEIAKLLKNYGKSDILQDHFSSAFNTLFYANIINNFFTNLNNKNIKEFQLPRGQIGLIKNKYKYILKDIKISLSLKHNIVDKIYYENFKTRIMRDFSEFYRIIQEIERLCRINEADEYLNKKAIEIRNLGKSELDLDGVLETKVLELYVKQGEFIPLDKRFDKLIENIIRTSFPKISEEIVKILNETMKEIIECERRIRDGFESRLYYIWEEPLDSLEALIKISLESGEKQKGKLTSLTNENNRFINEALILIHARAIQISNEILVLLKSGYADGANARWRSLHELTVISYFLIENSNEVSERYLNHVIINKFKEARDYRRYYKKLRYPPFERKIYNEMEEQKNILCKKYGDRYQDDYGWIPSSILSNRSFKSLEEHIKLNYLRPFYNLACDSVHGGASGFYRLGLMDNQQHKILLAGASNYGLADPLRNTAISLSHITICLLHLKHDVENIIASNVIMSFVKDIDKKAVNVQENIEDEEGKKCFEYNQKSTSN